jgi:hypothetical protein
MFSKHVDKELSAYCHGELPAAESRRVAEHLIGCHRCRAEFEEVKLGVKLAEHLPQISAPDSLWNDLQPFIAARTEHGRTVEGKRSRFGFILQPRFAAIAAAVALAIGFAAFWLYTYEARPFWDVARIDGAPRIGSARIGDKGKLALGQWLETDSGSRARINVGTIGQVEIDPNTRVRLVQTKPTEHRLELARGRMSARIWAPPKLFFVDTPSGVAADLGCAYTLEVDDAGGSLLRVTSGWVALQLKDRESMVPAGAACATRPGIGPGTPYFEDASESFRAALSKLDFDPKAAPDLKTGPLDVLLAEARVRDTLTLWHLLARLDSKDRARVFEAMAALVPPPDGVTRDGVLQLNEQMLQLWKDKLVKSWSDDSGLRKAWIKVWTQGLGKIDGWQGKK